MGIVQLIRYGPNLETLDVPGLGCPAADLAQRIRDRCQKLTFLTGVGLATCERLKSCRLSEHHLD